MAATTYRALVESARRLVETDTLGEIEGHSFSYIACLVEQNRQTLDTARGYLGPLCHVPVRFDRSFIPGHTDDFSHLRNLARAFRVEALLAASQKDFATAASVSIDILELANAARRGGLVVDLLVGNAISGIGVESLRKIRAHLNDQTRRQLIDALRRLENEREPFVDIYARDQAFEAVVGSDDGPTDIAFERLMDEDDFGLSEEDQQFIVRSLQQYAQLPECDQRRMQVDLDLQTLAMTRLLRVDAAVRLWEESSLRLPNYLSDLVPQILSDLPSDPFTEQLFCYRPTNETTFVLYSTGPKRKDRGGKFGPWSSVSAGIADLCLDANDYLE